MKVCLVVGSAEARFCGVKDYALRLAEALRGAGVEAEVRAAEGGWWRFRRELREAGFDVVHVQYPAIGFGYSLMPMLLGAMGVGRCVCVTLHEYGAMPWVQRLAMQGFRATARGLVFTTEAERRRYGAEAAGVIGIGSNVMAPGLVTERSRVVIYFGQVRPQKGLEAFLDVAARQPELSFEVLGAGVEKHRAYLEGLRVGSAGNVRWILDEPLEVVAERMSGALAAYLPFPDGATLKRGSLLGALTCGLPVVTTISAETPEDLGEVVLGAESAEEAGRALRRLEGSPLLGREMGDRGRDFAGRFSWAAIADAHVRFYGEMLGS